MPITLNSFNLPFLAHQFQDLLSYRYTLPKVHLNFIPYHKGIIPAVHASEYI
jgi:hypothetical protein